MLGSSFLLNILIIALPAFVIGYFLITPILWGITILVVGFLAYIWWVIPFEELEALIPILSTFAGGVFLLVMWMSAGAAKAGGVGRALQAIGNKILRK